MRSKQTKGIINVWLGFILKTGKKKKTWVQSSLDSD